MRSIHFVISASVCAIPFCLWAALQAIPANAIPMSPQSVAEAVSAKGDRTVSPFNIGNTGVSVELSDHPQTAITIRDTNGSLVYKVDPAARTTTIAKRIGRAVTTPATSPVVRLPVPDGCESAFSPYVNPDKADVIGRCIS